MPPIPLPRTLLSGIFGRASAMIEPSSGDPEIPAEPPEPGETPAPPPVETPDPIPEVPPLEEPDPTPSIPVAVN